MKEPVSILSRLLSAIVGSLIGGVVGMLALYYLMLLVRSDFGLDNVRLGALFGGVVGFLLGLRFPKPFAWHRLPF